jgi:hypothetical protein
MATSDTTLGRLPGLESTRLVSVAEHGAGLRADLKLDTLPGPDHRPEKPHLAHARQMAMLPARKPTEADRPPPSTLPMTPAAKVALEMSGAKRRRKR